VMMVFLMGSGHGAGHDHNRSAHSRRRSTGHRSGAPARLMSRQGGRLRLPPAAGR
jgi:hypothetical protein